jgi:uncharacterized membrane protein
MDSRVKVLDHPLHPALVHLPVGLLATSLIFDIIALATGGALWAGSSFWLMVFGAGFALLAAIPGLIDYFSLDFTPATHRLATYHMLLNLTIIALFIVDIIWRRALFFQTPDKTYFVPIGPFILSIIAIVLLAISGWIGGDLVYNHHVAVSEIDASRPGQRDNVRTSGFRRVGDHAPEP